MANIRDPQYGVKKDELTLTTQDPASVLYGVTSDNKWIPVKITDDGSLVIGNSLSLDAGDLEIGAVELKNRDTDDRAIINPDGELFVQGHTYGFDGSNWQKVGVSLVNGDYALDINLVTDSTAGVNVYNVNLVPAATETTIVSYLVPAGKTLDIKGFHGWGDWDAEFLVNVNAIPKGGGRSSPATRMISVSYEAAPIIATAGQTVTISTITNSAVGTNYMKATLMGGLR